MYIIEPMIVYYKETSAMFENRDFDNVIHLKRDENDISVIYT